MNENKMLELIVEQSVQELEKFENFEELNKHRDKFTFQEFNDLELSILVEMSDIKEEFFKEGFKKGINFILSMRN
ncbi:hypothetical protein P4481_27415 [Bacillus thuringiensis]|nr:hypothetical protein [Bacillus thuringiensis]